MSVEATVKAGAPLEVDLVARLQQPEVGLVKCLADGSDGICVLLPFHHRKAYAVVRDALVNLKLMGE